MAARRRLAVVKLQPWGDELPAILPIALSHRGGRARKAPPGRGDSGQAAGAARGLSLSCWRWLSLMGEAFLGRAPSSEGFCAGERGTGFVVNDVEGARQPSRGVPCHRLAGEFGGGAAPRGGCAPSAGAEDEELNGGFSGKWDGDLQSTFNPALLPLVTSGTAPLTCRELGLGGEGPLS